VAVQSSTITHKVLDYSIFLDPVREITAWLGTLQLIERPQLLARLHPSYLAPRGPGGETEVKKRLDQMSLIQRGSSREFFFGSPKVPTLAAEIGMPIRIF